MLGKTFVIGQLLPGGGAIGAVSGCHNTEMSDSVTLLRAKLSKAGSPGPPVSVPPPFLAGPAPSAPGPRTTHLLLFIINYIIYSWVVHWLVWGCDIAAPGAGCVFLVFTLHLLKPFKRFYLQEHFMDVALTWGESFKYKSLLCPVLFLLHSTFMGFSL